MEGYLETYYEGKGKKEHLDLTEKILAINISMQKRFD